MLNTKTILSLLTSVLCLYIVSIGFIDLLNLPYFIKKIQLPEVIAILGIFPLICLYFIKEKRDFKFYLKNINIIDISVLIYIVSLAIADLMGKHSPSIPALMGYFYLGFILVVVKTLFINIDNLFQKLQNAFIILALFQSFAGILGWLLWYFGNINNTAIQVRSSYLYFGSVARVQGFTGDPNMLASILSIAIIFTVNRFFYEKIVNKLSVLNIITLLVGLLFTMSKSALLIVGIIFILGSFYSYCYKKILRLLGSLSVFLFLFLTHFYIGKVATDPIEVNKGGGYLNEIPIYKDDNWVVYETAYSVIKKASISLFSDNMICGIGVGKQEVSCDILRQNHKYPISLRCYDPHCNYTGAFAETGIIGGFGYMLFISSLIFTIYLFLKKSKSNVIYGGLFFCIIFYIIEALTLENSTFRHHWVCFGILSGIVSYYNANKPNLVLTD